MRDAPQPLFDATHRARRQGAATASADDKPLWREAAEGLTDRLLPAARAFVHPLAVDGRAPAFLATPPRAAWRTAGFDAAERLTATAPADQAADLAVSLLSLHALDDLPGALKQIRQAMAPDGLFLAALFADETLYELKDSLAAGEAAIGRQPLRRIAPFADVRDLGNLLTRAGFVATVADRERTVVRYRDLSTLFADLKAMGETGLLARPRPPLARAALTAARAHYAAHHADADGRFRATFDIVYLTGWARSFRREKP